MFMDVSTDCNSSGTRETELCKALHSYLLNIKAHILHKKQTKLKKKWSAISLELIWVQNWSNGGLGIIGCYFSCDCEKFETSLAHVRKSVKKSLGNSLKAISV